jgi:hypothetical protein
VQQLCSAQPVEEPKPVWQNPHERLGCGGISPDLMTENLCCARVGAQQAGGHGEGGCLAGTVRPNEAEHAAAPDFEVQMINCALRSE